MIREFVEYQRQVRGLAPRTCEEYAKSLRAFAAWARPQGLRWSVVTKQDIDCFTAYMSEAKMSSSTIRGRISCLRSFFSYLQHEGKLQMNPAKWCQTPKREERLPQPADVEKIDAYLSSTPSSRKDAQMHMLTAILLETGCRISEALALKPSDFNAEEWSIMVTGKGNKQRKVFFGYRTAEAVRRFSWSGARCLFEDMTDVEARFLMYKTLGRYCEGIHPHQLRHTFGCSMINKGMNITSLASLMGHNNVHTTEIYARATAATAGREYRRLNL